MRTQCPHCQAKFKGPDSIAGKKVKCPTCKESFVCAEFIEKTVPLSAPKIQKCENCGRTIGNLEESFLDKNHVICKACKASLEGESQADGQVKDYGGISRAAYFWGNVIIGTIRWISFIAIRESQDEPTFGAIVGIISFAAVIYLAANRMENIGWSGWWGALIVVPIINTFIVIPCLVFQQGYRDTKKLDTDGKIIAGILLSLIVFILIIFVALVHTKTH
jgi:predicted Zn finger-like uncharacterized protein